MGPRRLSSGELRHTVCREGARGTASVKLTTFTEPGGPLGDSLWSVVT